MPKKKSAKIPKFKKNIKTFLNSEEGKISKRAIIKAGLIVGAGGAFLDGDIANADHCQHSSHSNDCSRWS